MSQFFVPPTSLSGDKFRIEGPEARHIVVVMRRKVGEVLQLFDGRGRRFEGRIERINGDGSLSGAILSFLPAAEPESAAELWLHQGLLKAEAWEWILEKGTELGVDRFIPILTPRSVVLLRDNKRIESKMERWRRILMAAAKQCQRAELPELREPLDFSRALEDCAGQGASFLAWERLSGAAAPKLGEELARARQASPGRLRVNLFIGPEGGFSQDEAGLAQSRGVILVGLGPRVLRAETAALAACALVGLSSGAR
ncbi:MAG: 16S rRNA (uracil(1498)-N(3))-methyltransferase [Elusimicrobia bacterium]|nr:16S rRNA (uracil(1498)-N(3))-methyltransferase [Elusimicrobiota bacterium]